jgi:formylglycine-generating enzyme required for sulfatase activity
MNRMLCTMSGVLLTLCAVFPRFGDAEEAARRSAPETGGVPAPPPEMTVNTIGMKLKLIPAGSFTMGSPQGEWGRSDDEGPQHKVTITKPFYIGVTEVTQAEYRKVMGTRLSDFVGIWGSGILGDRRPVVNVSWKNGDRGGQAPLIGPP